MSDSPITPPSNANANAKKYEGDGLLFKGKLIGMEDLQVDRDEKRCLDAMFKLKAVVKARGEHKQRIQLNLTMSAVKIIDDTSKAAVAAHEIERISFVVIDPRDTRAFGYVFNTADNRHQFWAIKTERAAAATVLALKELFEVAFEQFTSAEKAKAQPTAASTPAQEGSASSTVEQPAPVASTTPSLLDIWESNPTTPPSTTVTNAPVVNGDLFDINAPPLPVVPPAPPKPVDPLAELFNDLELTQPAPLPPPSTNPLFHLPPPPSTTNIAPSPPLGNLNLSDPAAPRAAAPPPPLVPQQQSLASGPLSPVAPPSVTNPFSDFGFLDGFASSTTTGRPTKESFFPTQPPPKTIEQLKMEQQS